ncbi:MAG: Hsp20/alpha crystallin family protein [Candidatus Hydrogenedentes bacterium]|nr:Hsp20/alpha crystallin family protein [Candidatus Hydrogenedentota bacterium]
MSNGEKRRSSKILKLFLLVLFAMVVAQGLYLYQLEGRLDRVLANAQPDTSAEAGVSPESEGESPNRTHGAPFGREDWFDQWKAMEQRMQDLINDATSWFERSPGFETLKEGFPFSPTFDLKEDGDQYVVRMDIPGANKADISVKLEDRNLKISGERKEDITEGEPGKVLRSERRIGRFERSVELPGPAEPGGMDAQYDNGVLTIIIKKGEGAKGSENIPIQ